MKPTLRTLLMISCIALTTVTAGAAPGAAAEDGAPSDDNPMAPFARLIGGEWHIGPYRHAFEWGIARRTVLARTYDQDGELSSEARWFWHPGEEIIRGYSIDAAGAFFAEMTTRFDGDTLTNQLKTFDADGAEDYTAVWTFTDDDHYSWTLHAETAEGPKQVMKSAAERR